MDMTYPILRPGQRGKDDRKADHDPSEDPNQGSCPVCRELTTGIMVTLMSWWPAMIWAMCGGRP